MLLSSFMDRVVDRLERLTSRQSVAVLTLCLAAVILINGIGLVPPEHYQRISMNPFVTRTNIAPANYWQADILLPLIGFFTHWNGHFSFNLLCFVIILGGYLLFARFAIQRAGTAAGVVLTVILMTSPLTTTLLAWLGTPDGLTFALTIPLLFATSSLLLFLFALLGATNHVAFIVAAAELVGLRWFARENLRLRHLLLTASGCIIGDLLVEAFPDFNHIQVVSRLDFLWQRPFGFWLRLNAAQLPRTLFSLFNIQWLILGVCLLMCYRMDRRYYVALLAALVLNYFVIFFTEDTTRVWSLLSWALLLHCMFRSLELSLNTAVDNPSHPKQLLQAFIVVAMVSFITLRYYSYNGAIYSAPFLASLPWVADFVRQGG